MDGPLDQYVHQGPWDGLDETGQGGPSKLLRALNVVLEDGPGGPLWRRRPGRAIVGTPFAARRVNAILEHVDDLGARQIVVVADPADPVGVAAVGLLDEQSGAFVAASSDGSLPNTTPQDEHTVAVPWRGRTLLAGGSGDLLVFDGTVLAALRAVLGADALDAVEGAAGYLAAPPLARILAVWRNRVCAIAGPGTPRTIGLSADDGEEAVVKHAELGGAQVWPARTNFDAKAEDSDEIMAATVLNDLLVVFTRRAVGVVDEDAVAPVLRFPQRRHGCVAPRSVQNIGEHAIYLTEGAVVAFDGQIATPISGPIEPTLSRVDWQHVEGAVSAHLRAKQEYRLWLPLAGEGGNRICVIFDYRRKRWRVASGWLPFDTLARRSAAEPFDVTAAATVLTCTGEELLLTGDSQGRIWREDVGEDDNGKIFPAYIAPGAIAPTPEIASFRDVRVRGLLDGAFLELFLLPDGLDLEQELVRAQDGGAFGDYPHGVARALDAAHATWAAAAGWPIAVTGPRVDWVKIGAEAHAAGVQVVLALPGVAGGVEDPARGGVRDLEVVARSRKTRRTDGTGTAV